MKKLLLFLLAIAIIPSITLANGGDQRVVENKYLINLSRAPFTPRVGVKTSFLASFVDLQKNKLTSEDLIVAVRIAKLGGIGTEKRTFIYVKENIPVTGGILELPYTFAESGLHEIFFDFSFASNPQKIYEAPDFLLDVQKPLIGYNINQIVITAIAGLFVGLIAGWFVKTIVNSRVG